MAPPGRGWGGGTWPVVNGAWHSMPVYAYRAVDVRGAAVIGELIADTAAAGREQLRAQGLRLAEFRPAKARSAARRGGGWLRGARREQAAEIARQLALLLRSGVPLVDALETLTRQQPRQVATVLRSLKERVCAGWELSAAMEEHAGWFDEVFRRAVRVGEAAGTLDVALTDLAKFIRERHAVRTRLMTALAYPCFLAVLGCGIVVFLMTYVVPQLLAVIESSGRSLPATTAAIKWASDTILSYWWLCGAGAVVVAGGAAVAYRQPAAREWLHRAMIRAPVLGDLMRKAVAAQFAQLLLVLLRSGLPMVEALRLVGSSTGNALLRREIAAVEQALTRGADLSEALSGMAVLPPAVARIAAVGQTTGELTELLGLLSDAYATEVQVAAGRFAALLEPVMIVVMSVVVGFIVLSVMLPILEATRSFA